MRASLSRCALFCAALACSAGCEEPVVAPPGGAAEIGGARIELGAYDVRYLELFDGAETVEYKRAVLALPITIKNIGEGALPYSPTHDARQGSELTAPLLYLAPDAPEGAPPPASKGALIKGVYVSRGVVPGQINEARSIAPGESLTDLYLFELPPEGAGELILSAPPTWHRAKVPALLRIDYAPKEASGPRVYAIAEGAAFDGALFQVDSVETAYIKTEDKTIGDGFSSEPLLRVRYTIKNESDAPLTYEPNHRAVAGAPGARLSAADGSAVGRIQFGPSTRPEGQLGGDTELAPQESVSDYVLFRQPEEGSGPLLLEFPAALFERRGTARVSFDYEYVNPTLPAELTPKSKPTAPAPDAGAP